MTSSRHIANGNLLRRFLNQKVNIMVNIDDMDSSGKILNGKTTDGQSIRIGLSEVLTSPVNGWVEVLGVPTGSDFVNCDEIIMFEQKDNDETFDAENHNMLVVFLNNCEDVFKSG